MVLPSDPNEPLVSQSPQDYSHHDQPTAPPPPAAETTDTTQRNDPFQDTRLVLVQIWSCVTVLGLLWNGHDAMPEAGNDFGKFLLTTWLIFTYIIPLTMVAWFACAGFRRFFFGGPFPYVYTYEEARMSTTWHTVVYFVHVLSVVLSCVLFGCWIAVVCGADHKLSRGTAAASFIQMVLVVFAYWIAKETVEQSIAREEKIHHANDQQRSTNHSVNMV